MPTAIIYFPEPDPGLSISDVNSNLQIGDTVYYSQTTQGPNSNVWTTLPTVIKLGVVTGILEDPPTVLVNYDDDPGNTGSSTVFPPEADDFIMFEKNKQVNSSSLIGYYADVKLLNNSTEKIELFSLGSEVTESSK